MYRYWFAAGSLLLTVASLVAQVPAQPGSLPPGTPGSPTNRVGTPGATPATQVPATQPQPARLDEKLVAHLLGWEKAMKNVNSYAVETSRTAKNLVTKREDKYTGMVWVMKPGLARYNLSRVPQQGQKPDSKDFTAAISDGKNMYYYDGGDKTVTVIKNGATHARVLLLDLMRGMTAQDMVNRFELELQQNQNQNKDFVYLTVRPRHREDKEEFEVMTLVLFGPTAIDWQYLPRMIVMNKTNGQEQEIWDFPSPKVNPQGMKVTDFNYQEPPREWRVQQATDTTQPRPPVNPRLPAPGSGK